MQIRMFHQILGFSTLQNLPNEKNADLDVSEDFMIFNFSGPSPFEKNTNLDVSEDFELFRPPSSK